MVVRSSASTNRIGAWKEAATVWPGSTLRLSTTPSKGERRWALSMLVSSDLSEASAWATEARALASAASARLRVATAVSISLAEGTLPPDRAATWRKRARLARASATVAWASTTLALAAARLARERATASSSLARSSLASTWPLLTRSLSST